MSSDSRQKACDLTYCVAHSEKQTALHLAAIYGSEASVRLLLKHGASYNARDSADRTPLHLATYDDFLGVTRALLDFTSPVSVSEVLTAELVLQNILV